MKYLFTFLCLFVMVSAQAQWSAQFHINFDTVNTSVFGNQYLSYQDYIYIDTVTYPNNKWQVGHPHKTAFTAAYSNPNAIVTDTLSACAPNDTSIFILKIPNISWAGLTFFYKLDIDSNDIVMIENYFDTGRGWINILTDTTNAFSFLYGKPDLSKSTIGWDSTSVSYSYEYPAPDTFLFRFTYITDSSTRPRDGWMMDDFWMGFIWEGIKNINQNVFINLYPNPANKELTIKHTLPQAVTMDVVLMNSLGQIIYSTERKSVSASDNITIDVSAVPDGMYFCMVTINGQKVMRQVTVLH